MTKQNWRRRQTYDSLSVSTIQKQIKLPTLKRRSASLVDSITDRVTQEKLLEDHLLKSKPKPLGTRRSDLTGVFTAATEATDSLSASTSAGDNLVEADTASLNMDCIAYEEEDTCVRSEDASTLAGEIYRVYQPFDIDLKSQDGHSVSSVKTSDITENPSPRIMTWQCNQDSTQNSSFDGLFNFERFMMGPCLGMQDKHDSVVQQLQRVCSFYEEEDPERS